MPQVQALVCLGPPVSFLSRSPSSAVTPLAPVFIPAFSLLPGEGFCALHTFCGGCTRKGSGALLGSTQHVKRSCTMEGELGQLQKKKPKTCALMYLPLNTSYTGGAEWCSSIQLKNTFIGIKTFILKEHVF